MSASVNYRTDFKTFEVPAEGAEYTFSVPFRFSYYTTGATAFVASHCNGEYNNCELLEDGRLKVTFDNHGLAPGRVLCRREFYLTDEDYNDGICNAVFDTTTDIFLTLSGSDLGDITVELPPFYQKGDPFKWEDMTAEQRDCFIEQVGADVVATNEAVIAAEAQRVIAENERSERFESVMQEATTQAGYAKEQGDYAKAQGEYALEQGEYAFEQGEYAMGQGDYAYAEAEGAKKTNQDIKDAEAQRVLAEQERGDRWAELSGELDTAITQAGESSSNADAATERANTAAGNADAATERANKAADNADAAREAIQEDLGRKANTDGTYSKMTVGFAENVVGDGSATAEEFSFRPTAGVNRNTLNDGAARIHTLKGNSVVVNNLIGKDNSAPLYAQGIQGNYVNGYWVYSGTATNTSVALLSQPAWGTGIKGHKIILFAEGNHNFDELRVAAYYANSRQDFGVGEITTLLDNTADIEPVASMTIGQVYSAKLKYKFIDLTLMFSAGNEPTTVAEFYQRMPLGVDLDVYNEGEIVDGHYGAIKTTGFNQWDEQWELGMFNTSTGEQDISYENIRNVNPIRVLPNTTYYEKQPRADSLLMYVLEYTQDGTYIGFQYVYNRTFTTSPNTAYVNFYMSIVYGTVYNNDICISLYWPTEYGNLYGTYKPYKPFERDLSWVAKYFPNGMRSAGNVADEIRFNSTTQQWEAVQRVDVRPYAAGDESDSAVTTDGTNTNYTLATPTITPITENINFDYDVSDYGTEELIVAEGVESAPLSASIEYSPNVLAVLKNAPDIANDVDMLKSQLAALTAQLAAVTASTDIPILV